MNSLNQLKGTEEDVLDHIGYVELVDKLGDDLTVPLVSFEPRVMSFQRKTESI